MLIQTIMDNAASLCNTAVASHPEEYQEFTNLYMSCSSSGVGSVNYSLLKGRASDTRLPEPFSSFLTLHSSLLGLLLQD